MKAILSNMLWLPKNKLTEEQIQTLKKQLTVIGKTRMGSYPTCKTYSDSGDVWFGTPRAWGRRYEFEDQTILPRIQWPELKFPSGGGWREGQEQSVRECLERLQNGTPEGRLEAKCGSGKNLMSMAVASQLHTPILVLVHKNDLAAQWRKDAMTFFPGIVTGHVQGDMWRYRGGHITTAMVQTLWAKRGCYPTGFSTSFGMVVIDEGHRYSADIFEYILKVFPCRYRLGVSATWRRSDGLEQAFVYHLGPVISECKVHSNPGKYVQIQVKVHLLDYVPDMHWARLLNSLAGHEEYNNWLVEHCFKAVNADRKVMVLSDRIDQLKYMKTKLDIRLLNDGISKTTSLYVGAVDGKIVSREELQFARKADIIFGTYSLMAEGTDIPSLDTLIMATPRSDVEQCIGRIQRYHVGKKKLAVIDPVLQYPIFQRLARKRERWYRKCGFVRSER